MAVLPRSMQNCVVVQWYVESPTTVNGAEKPEPKRDSESNQAEKVIDELTLIAVRNWLKRSNVEQESRG